MSEREKVMECLRQLEEHSPTWVKKIRAYILKLEKHAALKNGHSP